MCWSSQLMEFRKGNSGIFTWVWVIALLGLALRSKGAVPALGDIFYVSKKQENSCILGVF